MGHSNQNDNVLLDHMMNIWDTKEAKLRWVLGFFLVWIGSNFYGITCCCKHQTISTSIDVRCNAPDDNKITLWYLLVNIVIVHTIHEWFTSAMSCVPYYVPSLSCWENKALWVGGRGTSRCSRVRVYGRQKLHMLKKKSPSIAHCY